MKINLSLLEYILLMKLAPRILTIHNGQLKQKEQNYVENDNQKVIKYIHTIRATPDDYHTEQIKLYRKQNEQLRRNFKDLQKAYWGLLGYCQEKLDLNASPIHQLYKDGGFANSTQNGSISKSSFVNVSQFQLDDVIMKIEESRKKPNRLSQSILQEVEIEQFRKNIKVLEQGKIESEISGRSRNAKTQPDEDIEDLLIQAFKQVQELKQLLESVKMNSSVEIEQLKANYESKIQGLQLLLQKERKQSRMLNGVINRMRDELQSKQNFFKAIKEVRSGPQKILIERLLKQHRVSN